MNSILGHTSTSAIRVFAHSPGVVASGSGTASFRFELVTETLALWAGSKTSHETATAETLLDEACARLRLTRFTSPLPSLLRELETVVEKQNACRFSSEGLLKRLSGAPCLLLK